MGDINLQVLPDDLFDSMPLLTFLHLGNHPQLLKLPAFTSLANLKSMSFAMLSNVLEIPSFEHLRRLQRLEMIAMFSLTRLPNMSPLRNLVQLSMLDRGQVCCNGFLGDACNLTSALCAARPEKNLPTASCLPDDAVHATPDTKKMFQRFHMSVCVYHGTKPHDGVTKPDVDICDGVMYRQCPPDAFGNVGICSSQRMGVLMCYRDIIAINVRRAQIQRDIGTPCDPKEEAWLGCRG